VSTMAPMSVSDIFITAGAILGSVGVGGATVAALSGWLGKVWANRLMEQDRAKYASDLEALKSRFEQSHRRLQAELDLRSSTKDADRVRRTSGALENHSASGKSAGMDSSGKIFWKY